MQLADNVFLKGAGMGGADILAGGAGADTFLWGAARDVVDSGVYLGLDNVTDFGAGGDRLDVGALVGTQAWTQLSDVVKVTDAAAGTLVSVKVGGTFQDVVQLDGVHGLTDAGMLASGMPLL